MTVATSGSNPRGSPYVQAWAHRLPIKFLVLVSTTFLAIIVPGLWLLLGFMQQTDEATLTARVGNLAARVATAIERHHAFDDPLLSSDLMSPLAADRAFLCAELRSSHSVVATVPRGQGCMTVHSGAMLELPADESGQWILRIGFTDAELREARQVELVLAVSGITLAFLATLIAGILGFHYLIWRPLQLLTLAIVQSSETGMRRAVAWSSRDEMGLVVEAFNGLVEHEARREQDLTTANDRLQASEAALSALNRGLEARVGERTRQLEQEKLKAEIANDTKTRFLWSMSHELRTPLNAIIGFSEIMSQGMFGPMENQRYLQFTRDINQSGCHLLEIINDLLDIARIEVGQETLSEEPVAIAGLIADCLRIVQPMAGEKQLGLQADPVAPGLTLLVDCTKMKQILLNLLSNAIKNTPADGRISIQVTADPQLGVTVSVVDNGRGIAAGDIETALEPFGRIEDDRLQASKGTGLGLPLARMMIEMHDGQLTIDSAVGRGTVVVVRLPATRIVKMSA